MSKSKGNFYVLKDLEEKGFTTSEVRFTLIGAHYRKQLNFNLDSLHAAREALWKLKKAEQALAELAGNPAVPSFEELKGLENKGLFANAWEGLNEDLNTQRAIGAMFGALRRAQNEPDPETQWKGLQVMIQALGIELPATPEEEKIEIPSDIQALATERWAAREAKQWERSDELRDQLKAKGWVVKDGQGSYEVLPE